LNLKSNNLNQILRTFAAAFCLTAGLLSAQTSNVPLPRPESKAQHDARMAWWRDARFGMFIHWGLYSETAGYWDGKPTSGAGEWIMNDMQIPLSQYAKLAPEFDPMKFNADQWVKIAKNAGMKYIVITSKHHEGFGMWPSQLTDWCIKSTPFHRDPLKELAAACKKEGIKLCFYYSIMDWHSPLYAPRKPWNDIATNPPDFDAYDQYMKGQLKELLTGYGPIGLLWFDGEWENTWTYDRGVDLYNYVRGLQPNIIVNNRVGTEQKLLPGQIHVGDYKTPEQYIPPNGYGDGVDWETCMTMNDTWGYKRGDDTWKSTPTLIRNLVDIASKGGNYLLNVGPTGEGVIPEASVERLKEIGAWIKVNGKAIYGTTASPFSRQLPWGRCTTKISGNHTTLYLHVFDWPTDGELLVPGLKNKIHSAHLLKRHFLWHKHLVTTVGEDGLHIRVPSQAPDKISSTIVLKFKGAPEIVIAPILQKADGSISLPASEANLHGSTFQYESGGPLDDIGYWTNPEDWADWDFKVTQPGKFAVSAVIAAPASGAFEISAAGQTLHCAAPVTGNYITFKPVELGTIEIPSTGKMTLAVHPVKDGWQPMNLKAITLKMLNP
jgi:alpha-L-fucosidase